MKRDFLLFTLVFVLLAILIQVFLFSGISGFPNVVTGKATDSEGSFSVCLGYPIHFNFSNCSQVINQSTRIVNNTMSCAVLINQSESRQIVFNSVVVDENGLYYRLFENGTLIVDGSQEATFQPGFPSVSNDSHNVSVSAYDGDLFDECLFEGQGVFEITFLDINDPPHFISNRPIEDIVMREGQRVLEAVADSFDDVDVRLEWSQPLTFNYYKDGGGSSQIIKGFNGSYVVLESSFGNCPIVEYVFFEAVDPEGLVSDSSNVVRLEVECLQDPDSSAPPSSDSSFGPCISEWRCDEWSECFVNGTQSRLCEDIACGDDPKKFWRDCEYIPEELEEEEEFLVVDTQATCFDGLRNCHVLDDGSIICEEGVDCGGPCDPCRRIEVPALIIDEEADNMLLFLALIVVSISIFVALYLFFKKQIHSFFAKVGWWLTRKRRKQILLDLKNKEELLKEVNLLYSKVYDSSLASFVRKDREVISVVNLSRKYLLSALGLNEAFNLEEIKLRIDKVVFNESLRTALFAYARTLFAYELKSVELSRQELLNFVQETRMVLLNTSKLSKNDFNFKALELDVKGSNFEKAKVLVHNSYLALCFSEVVSAKKNYHSLLGLYEELSDVEKNKVYNDLNKIYNYIKTIISWV